MSLKRTTNFGSININDQTVATLVANTLSECYGVVGMASKHNILDAYYEILKLENISKGIEIRNKDGLEVDVFIIVSYGVKISEVLSEVQKRLKYEIEQCFSVTLNKVNIYVQGVK